MLEQEKPWKTRLNCGKSELYVVDDVVDVFQAAAEANHSAVDACRNKLLVRELAVRRAGRVEHACTDIGDMNFIAGKLKSVHKADCGIASALNAYGNYTAASFWKIFLSQRVRFVIRQSWICDTRNFIRAFEKLSDF